MDEVRQSEIQRQIEALREEIRRHDRLYYTEASPEIADHEYDRLMHQLRDLESAHPEYHDPASPTQRIGDPLESGFAKVAHRVPMLSMDNTYTEMELRNFLESRVLKPLSDQAVAWVVEPKIDGVAVSLIYERGRFVQAITRGDGRVGDEITANMRTVRGIPLQLAANPATLPEWLEIRGEIYMTHDDLEAFLSPCHAEFARTAPEPGVEEKISNPRNVTAGAIHQKDPMECARRHLRFMAHSVGDVTTLPVATHIDFLKWVRSLGIPTAPKADVLPDLDAAIHYCNSLMEEIHELPFEIDGFVLKVNRFDQRTEVGTTAKSPRWMVAWKFEKYETEAKLVDILWQVGKSGAVTPVAVLVEPEYDGVTHMKEYVVIAGTKVRRASLHNPHEITSKDVRLGDRVIVAKAGKIIPQIVRVETHLRPTPNTTNSHNEAGNNDANVPAPYVLPQICPVCGAKLAKRFAGIADLPMDSPEAPSNETYQIFCTSPSCPAQMKERIVHYASRRAMDLTGLGDEMVGRLVDAELLRGIGDLYRLTEESLLPIVRPKAVAPTPSLPGFDWDTPTEDALPQASEKTADTSPHGTRTAKKTKKETSRMAEKIVAAIQESKTKRDLGHLLYALAIPQIGEKVGRTLATAYGSMETLRGANADQIASLPDIGPMIAGSVYHWLHSDAGAALIDELTALGVRMDAVKKDVATPGPFAGKTFVVTGTLQKYTRDQIESLIESLGGKTSKSVSSKTSYVVAGNEAGSKLEKAQRWNVPVLTEEQFEQMLPTTQEPYRPLP